MRNVVTAARLVLAILFLHAALTMFYWLPAPRPTSFLAPTWDLVALLSLIVLWAALRDGSLGRTRVGRFFASRAGRLRESKASASAQAPPRRTAADRALPLALSAGLMIFMALGFAQGFARREFGYDLVLPLHAPYIPELFRMMYDHEPFGMFLLYCTLLVVGLVGALVGIYASVRTLIRVSRARRGRLALVAVVGGALVLALPTVGVQPSLAGEAVAQAGFAVSLEDRLEDTARGMELESQRNRPPSPFKRMEVPPSIYNFVIESYGAVTFRDEAIWESAKPALARRLEELEAAGYAVRTGYLDAPSFGGSSWMAQQTLLCGVWVNNQERFESLFKTRVRCLPELLNEAGYWTVVAAGNTTYLEDRYERKFPFDAYYFRDDFNYQGRRYGWSYIPDQFAIHFVDEQEIRKRRDRPQFVHFQLTTSHHPWSDVPPLIEDWDSIEDGSEVLSQAGKEYSNQFVSGDQYKMGYWNTVDYSMRVITDYVTNLPDDDALIMILGDHQPRKPVASMNDDTWWVPVHVLSRDERAVDRFASLGYVEGIEPPDLKPGDPDQAPDGLDHFIRHIFEVYGDKKHASRGR